MPTTIHHEALTIPARTIPAWDETLYTYDELEGHAKERAYQEYLEQAGDAWADFDIEDISDCARHVLGQIGADFAHDHEWAYAVQCRGASFEFVDLPRFGAKASDNGVCFSYDFVDAWEAHARRIRPLEAMALHCESIADDADSEEARKIRERFAEDLFSKCDDMSNEALRALESTFNHLCTSACDYRLSDEGASDYYAEECALFDEDGERSEYHA